MTYLQLVKRLEEISLANPLVGRFGNGDISKIDSNVENSTDYPYVWLIPQTATMAENTLTYNLRILCFELDRSDDSSQLKILSDTLRILYDIIKTIRYDDHLEYMNDNEITATPFTERFTDYTSGWYIDINIVTDIDNCQTNIPQ